MMMTDDQFMTTEEVLEYLHLNLKTVYRLIKSGKLPAVRVGRQWRFRKRDLDAWFETGAAAREHDTGSADRPSLLIVDDERSVRELIAATLSAAEPGYDITVAADGPSALAMLGTKAFDVLIADLKMPGMDGLTLIREARAQSPDLPVVIITAVPSQTSAIDAVNLGVSGYLTKPFRSAQIQAAVAKALHRPTSHS
jgi:excisionase family DNA binding protein